MPFSKIIQVSTFGKFSGPIKKATGQMPNYINTQRVRDKDHVTCSCTGVCDTGHTEVRLDPLHHGIL